MENEKTFAELLREREERIAKSTGIRRLRVEAPKFETFRLVFQRLGDAMLAWRGASYQCDLLMPAIKTMYEWAYCLTPTFDDDRNNTRGLLLKGYSGRGKTMLMRIFVEMLELDGLRFRSGDKFCPLAPRQVNVRKVAAEYQEAENPYAVLKRYATIPSLCLEDIGAEPDLSSNYGNKANVITQLLDLRNESHLLTFGTTNLEHLSDKYDDRTTSRMNELFYPVAINHKIDFRKK